VASAAALAGCGGSSADHSTSAKSAQSGGSQAGTTQPRRTYDNYYPPGTHKAPRAAVHVVTAWSDQLRAGHVRVAARYFALPVLVQNASPLVRLTSKRQVLEFNRGLPCGAHIVRTLEAGRYVVATFVLTERPGSEGCGATGKLAATAFLLDDHGKIKEWRRVLVPPPLGPPQNLKQSVPSS
jgi:hypothetical protein